MSQMTQVRKLGSMGRVMGMIPGMSELSKPSASNEGQIERQMNRMRAMYDSMTKAERHKPDLLDGPRRRRIAAGSGVATNEIGQFVKQFETTRDMMRAVGGPGMAGKMKMMKGLMGGGLAGLARGRRLAAADQAVGVAGAQGPEQEEEAVTTVTH